MAGAANLRKGQPLLSKLAKKRRRQWAAPGMILTAADPIEGFAPEAPACQGNSTQEQSIQGLLQGPFFHLTKRRDGALRLRSLNRPKLTSGEGPCPSRHRGPPIRPVGSMVCADIGTIERTHVSNHRGKELRRNGFRKK